MNKDQEELRDTLEKKIDNVEKRIAFKMEEQIAVVAEKIEKKVREEIGRIKELIEGRIEEVAGNFNLVSQRVEELEKNVLSYGNEDNEMKFVPALPIPVLASPVSLKL
ncbi:hypothetical protein TNCV_3762981 [Trichonephila clavipes]|uniref:Uncharacterized protein n=1 Tax=Trichonephila clavipes TaxID=2585209 RepID=A0A8X7B8D4_TRICX|nr:hypothetical protein TNCV_3762981 [Trichonephila clavipes]